MAERRHLLIGSALALSVAFGGPAVRAQALPEVHSIDPPAFGHQVGDVVRRELQLSLSPGSRFDPASLPSATRHGAALELSSVEHTGLVDDAHQTVVLRYQIFRSPTTPSVTEMPAVLLRFTLPQGAKRREMPVRVEAHPLLVSPIAPEVAPERRGLGAMQADTPTPAVDLRPMAQRGAAWAALAAGAVVWLATRQGLAWWRRRRGLPFDQAWRQLRRLGVEAGVDPQVTLDTALRALHRALHADAGRVLLAADLPAWLAGRVRYAGQAAELAHFQALSQQWFFGQPALDAATCRVELDRVVALGRQLAVLERAP